jgi:hypothetical protein
LRNVCLPTLRSTDFEFTVGAPTCATHPAKPFGRWSARATFTHGDFAHIFPERVLNTSLSRRVLVRHPASSTTVPTRRCLANPLKTRVRIVPGVLIADPTSRRFMRFHRLTAGNGRRQLRTCHCTRQLRCAHLPDPGGLDHRGADALLQAPTARPSHCLDRTPSPATSPSLRKRRLFTDQRLTGTTAIIPMRLPWGGDSQHCASCHGSRASLHSDSGRTGVPRPHRMRLHGSLAALEVSRGCPGRRSRVGVRGMFVPWRGRVVDLAA